MQDVFEELKIILSSADIQRTIYTLIVIILQFETDPHPKSLYLHQGYTQTQFHDFQLVLASIRVTN